MLFLNFSVIINIGVVLFTFVESYVFPFAIIKWMIVVTKCGGVWSLLRECRQKEPLRNRYSYNLQLITSRQYVNVTSQRVSHVNVLLEDEYNSPGRLQRMQLSYCGQDCKRIPTALQKMYGIKTKCLDLSYNTIETLKGLELFGRLEELILDNNKLGDGITFPYLPHLRTLSLNNNQITNLEALIDQISERFPSLTYLSLLSNKACPNQLSDFDKDDSDYQRYRYYVIYKLPHLRFLDSGRIFASERREATTRGEFMRVRRPADDAEETQPRPTQAPGRPAGRPLPVDLTALGKHKGAYGKCHYKYTGKHSEGNRFIVNSDL